MSAATKRARATVRPAPVTAPRPRYWWVDAPDDDPPVCPLCGGALIDDGGCRDPACPAKGNG